MNNNNALLFTVAVPPPMPDQPIDTADAAKFNAIFLEACENDDVTTIKKLENSGFKAHTLNNNFALRIAIMNITNGKVNLYHHILTIPEVLALELSRGCIVTRQAFEADNQYLADLVSALQEYAQQNPNLPPVPDDLIVLARQEPGAVQDWERTDRSATPRKSSLGEFRNSFASAGNENYSRFSNPISLIRSCFR